MMWDMKMQNRRYPGKTALFASVNAVNPAKKGEPGYQGGREVNQGLLPKSLSRGEAVSNWQQDFYDKWGIWPIAGGSGESGGSEEGGTSSAKTDVDGTNTEQGQGSDGGGQKEKGDSEQQKLSEEAAKHRQKAKELQDDLAKTKRELKELQDKGKSELELLQAKVQEMEPMLQENEKLKAALRAANTRLELVSQKEVKFKDNRAAIKMIDLDSLEYDDDGKPTPDSIKSALKTLEKEYPFLLAEEGEEGHRSPSEPSASMTGNGKKQSKEGLDRAELEKRFPALRSRVRR